MGTTIRREPNLTSLPKQATPHYENVLNFKGLHVTDNPFTADEASASDMLNVYVDDNNALTVRPRLEKSDDYDTIIGDYTLIKVEPLKNGKILLLLNGTTPVVKLVINNTTYTVSGVGTINVNTCNFYEDGDISVDGKIYLFDENGAKYIKKDGNAYVCGSISDIAYTPTVEIDKDLELGVSTKKEEYNVFTNKYKISYITKETPYDTNLTEFLNKKVTLNTKFRNDTYSFIPENIETIQFFKSPIRAIPGVYSQISMSNNGKILTYVDVQSKQVYISNDYGLNFEVYTASKDNVVYIPSQILKAWVSGDGTCLITIDENGVLTKFKNKIHIADVDLTNLAYNNVTYSCIRFGNSYLNNVYVTTNYSGTKIAFNYMFDIADEQTQHMCIMCLNDDFTTMHIHKKVTGGYLDKFKYLSMNEDGDYCVYWGSQHENAGIICTFNQNSQPNMNFRILSGAPTDPTYPIYIKDNISAVLWLSNTSVGFIALASGLGEYGLFVLNFEKQQVLTNTNYSIKQTSNYDYTHLFMANNAIYIAQPNTNIMKKYNFSVVDGDYIITDVGLDITATTTDCPFNSKIFTTTIIKNGILYDGSLGNLYTNNGYIDDINWISVEYSDYDIAYKINKSTNYMVWRDSLWLYGYKNQLGWSGYVNGKRDFTYFPEDQIFELGIDTTPLGEKSDITGFNVVGDNVASAYKRDKIYLIQPTTINNKDTYLYSECKAEQGNNTMGQTVVTPLSALPIQVNRDGVFALTNLTNVYAADKVATLISGKINEKFLKEDLSNIKLIAFKYWLFIFIPDNTSKVYVYDDRFAEWYYWELPIKVLNVFKTHDNLYCVSDDNVVFKFNPKEKLVNIDTSDAITLYYDDVYTEGEDNCFDAYGVQGKNVVWYWTSQILPLNSVSHAKQLSKTTFIVADSDVTDGYAFNFSIKGWRKKRTLVKSSDLDGTVYSVQATTKRTNINRAHFIQLTVTNAMLENHQLVLSKTLKTDIDTNDQKVRLIGVSFKYKYLEV